MFFEVSVNLISRKQSPDTRIPRVTTTLGEADRRRDAWIPMEKTRQELVAKATCPPGSYKPDLDMLTMPGILLDEEFEDEIGEPIVLCCREARDNCNKTKNFNLTPNERRLKELIQIGAYGAAINHTAMLLSLQGQGRGRQGCQTVHTPQTLHLWYIRLTMLIKIKSLAVAQAEAQPFSQLEKPDIFYQYYPEVYGTRTGSMASFSFRLLLAELPMHCGKPKESLRRLFSAWAAIKKMLNNLRQGLCEDGSSAIELSELDRTESLKFWMSREAKVIYSIINCACVVKDYGLAMELLSHLNEREDAPKHILLSALGRLNLQTGNIAGAEICFNEAYLYGSSGVRELVDRGLLAVAQNNFEEACACFQRANALEPSNVMILNNLGVSLYHDGRLQEAIQVIEATISSHPVDTLPESLILNLCSLYDLQSSKKGIMRKFALLRQISKYSADAPTTILEKLYG
ncbi:hypothetical protein ABEB36_001246 [Hypothenemus hampei]|uniref:Trafficking protein particle complex subunit 12 n=1 Tax=Hypothenemus hampei TaxID=57062 RepID=A0ABD1FDX5_HYPHA